MSPKTYSLSETARRALNQALRDEDFLAGEPEDMLDAILAWLSELADRSPNEEALYRELAAMPDFARRSMSRAIRAALSD